MPLEQVGELFLKLLAMKDAEDEIDRASRLEECLDFIWDHTVGEDQVYLADLGHQYETDKQ